MIEYTVYEDRDGVAPILTSGTCGTFETAMGQAQLGVRSVYVGHALDVRTMYFFNREPQQRPAIAPERVEVIADGADLVRFEGVPGGTMIRLSERREEKRYVIHQWTVVDDGAFDWSTTIPGEYEIEIEPPFPHQVQMVGVTAHAA